MFQNFWGWNYSKLKLPNARHDICGECFILANLFRYRKCAMKSDANDGSSDDDDADDELAEEQDPDFEA
jgi:hypothetical protein